jgi:hypothetical protein
VAILVHWRLWKERNARIFQQKICTTGRVFEFDHRGYSCLESCWLYCRLLVGPNYQYVSEV